jgi:hypothetical protein
LNAFAPAVVYCTGSAVQISSSLIEMQSTTPSIRQQQSLMKNNPGQVNNDEPAQGSSFGEL